MTSEKKPTPEIVDKAESFVLDLFRKDLNPDMQYHDTAHTTEVVEVSEQLAGKRGLKSEDLEVLLLAAWMHDTGFTRTYDGHEDQSVEIADSFLTAQSYDEDKKQRVLELIRSTVPDAPSTSLLAQILHDADISHMGRKRFFRKGELLRIELENMQQQKWSELEWEEKQYEFLTRNDFITPEAIEIFGARRTKNIKKQRQNILKARKDVSRKQTGKDFGRGIDTLYRTNYRNHINFSAIADGKANMMISINTILISVIVTLSGASLSIEGFTVERFRYTIPILVLLLGSLCSVLFAVLSARPKVTEKKVDMDDVKDAKISLLYFGNFLGIPKNEFLSYLSKLKEDQQRLYDSMSIDLYNLGAVLKEKYRLLSISYNIFMIGLTVSVVAFIVIFIFTNARH